MKEENVINSNIIKQGSILAMASVVVRIIGLLYRIPMANIIGENAMGIYSAAFEVYNILLILSSYSMPTAVSKLISIKFSRSEYRNGCKCLLNAMIFSAISGGIAALFLFFNAQWVEKAFFSNYTGIAVSLKILAPTIFFVSLMGVMRGFFQGTGNMVQTAVSQIIEQIINALVSIGAAVYFVGLFSDLGRQAAWGAAGGTLGTCIGALGGLLFLMLAMGVNLPRLFRQIRCDHKPVNKTFNIYLVIIATMIPIILSQTIYQISGIIDITLFNSLMGKKEIAAAEISALQGGYSTLYKLLISVPIAISTAFSASLIPGIAASHATKDGKRVTANIDKALLFNMNISIPSAIGLMAFGRPILQLLFPSYDIGLGSRMLFWGACAVIFYAYSTTTSTVLQGVNRMRIPVINSAAALVIHVFAVCICLRYTPMGVFALVLGNVLFPLIVMILNALYLKKHLKYCNKYRKVFFIPLLSAVIMGALGRGLYALVFHYVKSNVTAILISVLFSILLYFFEVINFKGIAREEALEFPGGKLLIKMIL